MHLSSISLTCSSSYESRLISLTAVVRVAGEVVTVSTAVVDMLESQEEHWQEDDKRN